MHTDSKDLHRRRLQVGYDVITAAAAAIRDEPELGFHLERLNGCRVKRAKNDDASKKVSDSQGRHHRQCQQVAGHGFHLRLPQPLTTDLICLPESRSGRGRHTGEKRAPQMDLPIPEQIREAPGKTCRSGKGPHQSYSNGELKGQASDSIIQ